MGRIASLLCSFTVAAAAMIPSGVAAAAVAPQPTAGPSAAAKAGAAAPSTGAQPGAATVTKAPLPPQAALTGPVTASSTPKPPAPAAPKANAKSPADAGLCGGALAFGVPVACAAANPAQPQTYTVTTTLPHDHLRLWVHGDGTASGVLTDAGGTQICGVNDQYNPTDCAVDAVGTYTLSVSVPYGQSPYTVAADSVLAGQCTTLPDSFFAMSQAARTGTLPAGSTGDCYRFTQPAGSRLMVDVQDTTPSFWAQHTVTDSTGAPACTVDASGFCLLGGTAPYTLRTYSGYAAAGSYSLLLTRASNPDNCAALPIAPFGDPGSSVAQNTLNALGGTDCRTVSAKAGALAVRGGAPNSGSVGIRWALYAKDGTNVCRQNSGFDLCTVPADGDYSLVMPGFAYGQPESYSFTVRDLASSAGCAASVGTGFDSATLTGTLKSADEVDCQPFAGVPGERVMTPANGLMAWITDLTGARICAADYTQDGCVLPGAGPYRVISYGDMGWGPPNSWPSPWALQIRQLSHATGCPALDLQAYGTAADKGTVRCRTVTVPSAGAYTATGFSTTPANTVAAEAVQLYGPDGKRACTDDNGRCRLAAPGTYTLLLGGAAEVVQGAVSTQFVSAAETRGCVAASDTGWVDGPIAGSTGAPGQYNCLTLPTASGSALLLHASPKAPGTLLPFDQVVDATGTVQCDNKYGYSMTDCPLTGQAPFRVLFNTGTGAGSYAVSIGRTDGPAGCGSFPQTPYSGGVPTKLSLSTVQPVRCLGIPANAHATAEQLDYAYSPAPASPPQTLPAEYHVFDASGKRVCQSYAFSNSATTCQLTAGKAYTALLVGDGTNEDYQLVRRDITQSAPCATPASTVIGGAPSTGVLDSSLSAACTKISAAATDRFRISALNSTGQAMVVVTDATGRTICTSTVYGPCDVTGSTSYQAIVTAYNYVGTPIDYRLDTWKTGSAAGVPSECPAVPSDAKGFGPLTGTLTVDHPGTCLALPVKAGDHFSLTGTYAGPGTTVPRAQLIGADGTNYCVDTQSTQGFTTECNVPYSVTAGSATFLLSLRPGTQQVAYNVTAACVGGTCGPAMPADGVGTAFSPLKPARLLDTRSAIGRPGKLPVAAGGTVALQVTGQGGVPATGVTSVVLNVTVADPTAAGFVTVWPSGASRPNSSMLNWSAGQVIPNLVTVPVGADGKVDLYNGSKGTADLVADVFGYYSDSQPGSTFVPAGPTRLLDTRAAIGTPGKSPVASKGTVQVKIAGNGGVPATGVSAVVLNVTATDATTGGYLTAWPSGVDRPLASNLNWVAGQVVPNTVVVPVGADGTVSLFNGAPGTVDLVADLAGYYTGGTAGALYRSAGPVRVVDTTAGTGAPAQPVAAHGQLVLDLNGTPAVAKAKSVVLDVTVSAPTASGFLTVWPSGLARPLASNLNWAPGQTVTNQVVVPVGADGKVDFYNGSPGTVQLVVDRIGYFS
ncbi:hypothetical protein GCM10009760_33880 [Kitasatospora kazusensis]|uniref:Uncharacterized protein n=1 Tax=Kitasatospora kazusensis TaxID=407974 RepID=A0ABP5LHL8_9ACTN